MSADCCSAKGDALAAMARTAALRRVLLAVLLVNALLFVVEFGAGLVAGSAALMADSVDMLGDAMVYGISLYAIGRGVRWQAGAALFKGAFILALGLGVLVQIGVKIAYGVPPATTLMVAVGALALAGNLFCLRLLWRFRRDDVNMSSTFECSRNDVIANIGVIAAAGGVAITGAAWPDILVASLIAMLFLRSAVRVGVEASRAWRHAPRGTQAAS